VNETDGTRERRGESGQTLVVFIGFAIVCLMFVGVVIDGGMYYFERRDMQGTADAAALAAVRELPGSRAEAEAAARDYVDSQNSAAHGAIRSLVISDNDRRVEIRVGKSGSTSFGKLLGIDRPEISARAVARVQMLGTAPGMLPFAFMKDSYTLGQNTEVKWDDPGNGNRGAIAPNVMPSCNPANGASDFQKLILGADRGGYDACASSIMSTIDTETGNMAGPTRDGFDQRITTNTDSYGSVVHSDPDSGFQTIEMPTSPRLGIVPIIENLNGTNAWPNGSKEIRIIGYMMVYIGNRDLPGNPAWSNNGKSVWMTPIRPILPEDWKGAEYTDYDASMPSPIVYRLVE
jgi:hypothetical protein